MRRRIHPLVDVERDCTVALLLENIDDQPESAAKTVAIHRKASVVEVQYAYSVQRNTDIKTTNQNDQGVLAILFK